MQINEQKLHSFVLGVAAGVMSMYQMASATFESKPVIISLSLAGGIVGYLVAKFITSKGSTNKSTDGKYDK